MKKVQYKTVKEMMGPVDDLVGRLASRLGKNIELNLEGSDLKVDPTLVTELFQNLPHMLRNSIDHGIEASADRGHKSNIGKIYIKSHLDTSGCFHFEVTDDGRGLDTKKIIEAAIKSKKISSIDASKLSEKQIMNLIFEDGVSTAGEISDISGRGVGMSAIRNAVINAGGYIDVSSKPGEGTRFKIVIPHDLEKLIKHAA